MMDVRKHIKRGHLEKMKEWNGGDWSKGRSKYKNGNGKWK